MRSSQSHPKNRCEDVSSRCWKRRRGSGPSKAEGRSRERGTETQREEEQRLRAETQAETRKNPQNHRLGDRGAVPSGEPEQRAQASPPPVSHNPHQGRGWPGTEPPPRAPGPALSHPSPCAVGSDPAQVPSDFPEAGNRGKLFPIQIPPPWRLHVFHSFPRTLESRLPSPSFFGPWNHGQDKDPRPNPQALQRSGPP